MKLKKILSLGLSILLTLNSASIVVNSENYTENGQSYEEEVNSRWTDEKVSSRKPTSDTAVINYSSLIVILKHEYSNIDETINADYFSDVNATNVEDIFKVTNYQDKEYFNIDKYRKILKITLATSNEDDLDTAVSILESRDDIRSISYDYYDPNETYQTELTTNDLDYYNYHFREQYLYYEKIGVDDVWNNYTMGNSDVKVGVIDTGFDLTNPNISNNIWNNEDEIYGNGIDDNNNGFIDDVHGWNFTDNSADIYVNEITNRPYHGTACMGVVAANPTASYGLVGVCPNATLVPLMVSLNQTSMASAILYAINENIDILNLSISSTYPSDAQKSALEMYDGLLFCAAGNNGLNIDLDTKGSYPTEYNLGNVISVTGTFRTGNFNSGFDYGSESVDLAAWGTSMWLCAPDGTTSNSSGTSYAAPMVAGVAALLKSYYPEATSEMIKTAILTTVTPNSSLTDKVRTGGYVNAYAALLKLQEMLPIEDNANVYIGNIENNLFASTNANAVTLSVNDFSADIKQKWTFEYQNNGYYKIKAADGTYLTYISGNTPTVRSSEFHEHQYWKVVEVYDGQYRIISSSDETKCLQITNSTLSVGNISTGSSYLHQLWSLKDTDYINTTDSYFIRNKATGKYLAITYDGANYNLNVTDYATSVYSKTWNLTDVDNDGNMGLVSNNLSIGLGEFNGHPGGGNYSVALNTSGNDEWTIHMNSDGSFKIISETINNPHYFVFNSTFSNVLTTVDVRWQYMDSSDSNLDWVFENVYDATHNKSVYIINNAINKPLSYISPVNFGCFGASSELQYVKWDLEYQGNDTYAIRDTVNGHSLMAYSGTPTLVNGVYITRVILSSLSARASSKWQFKRLSNGSYAILNAADNSNCMEILSNSNPTIIYSSLNSTSEESWSILPA